MPSIIDSITNLIPPQTISKITSSLGENSLNVNTAIKSTIASVLGTVLQKKGSGLESILNSAADSNVLNNISGLFNDNDTSATTENNKGIGSNLLTTLFGNKLSAFTQLISSHSGVAPSSSSKLVSMVAPLIAGFLGNKMRDAGGGISSLLKLLSEHTKSIGSLIPAGLNRVLDVPSLDVGKNNLTQDLHPQTKSGSCLWKWLLPLLIVLGLIWWFINSRHDTTDTTEQATSSTRNTVSTTTNDVVDSTKNMSEKAKDDVKDTSNSLLSSARELVTVTLPNGVALQGYKGGIEDRVVKFLESSEYHDSSSDDLKDKWFDFDNINFQFGSDTTLTPESQKQVKNIASILNFFKDAKIKIGAYTDKKGDDESNVKISSERAETIKSLLISEGVQESQIAGTEGYGSKFATVSADATDEERAKDRHIAIRFEK